MAELEKKTAEDSAPEAKKETAKPKKDKPSLFSRIAAWFRTTKAELKKIVWPSRETVLRNTALVLVAMVALSAVIGLLDYAFSTAIVGLSMLI